MPIKAARRKESEARCVNSVCTSKFGHVWTRVSMWMIPCAGKEVKNCSTRNPLFAQDPCHLVMLCWLRTLPKKQPGKFLPPPPLPVPPIPTNLKRPRWSETWERGKARNRLHEPAFVFSNFLEKHRPFCSISIFLPWKYKRQNWKV